MTTVAATVGVMGTGRDSSARREDPAVPTTPVVPTIPGIPSVPVELPVADLPEVGIDIPSTPAAGPDGETVRTVHNTTGQTVYGYENGSGDFVPLSYSEGLTVETGGVDDNSAPVWVAGAAAGMAALAGFVAFRRRRK
ncbi:LPXTG cell wall anchor domain-containing protein [Gordonia sp. NPDC003376]